MMNGGSQVRRQISLAYRLFEDVQRERLRTEGRLRSANLCRFCGGKKVVKKDHLCPNCQEGQPCSHCDGTGLDPVQIPAEALATLGLSLPALQSAEDQARQRLVRLF